MATVVVVRLPILTLPLPAAAQDSDEGLFKLAAVARVDDWVQAAVEVSQPEDDFEEGFRRTQAAVE